MSRQLPPVMESARESASRDGGRQLLGAFDALESEQPNLGWLALWKVAHSDRKPEPARTLSFALARSGLGVQVAEAIRLWFLVGWAGDDLSTLVNILTGVERAIDDEGTGVPPTARSSLMPFLHHCVRHDEVVVRHSVLDFLEAASAACSLDHFVHRASGNELALALEAHIGPTAEDDETEILAHVCNALRSGDLPEARPTAPRALQQLVFELEDANNHFASQLGDVRDLVEIVRLQALLDTAQGSKGGSAMTNKPDLMKLAAKAAVKDRYKKQIARVKASGQQTDCISDAVEGVIKNLPIASPGSLVVYGDPQSGKTEMMICLTARLLDAGHKIIVHLMNDSVDLLMQSLDRFKLAGLAPAPRNASDLDNSPLVAGHDAIVFCKKNAKDLGKLITALAKSGPLVIIDDEADYATPNSKINKNEKTTINELVSGLLGKHGKYIGVTATPARLNLNNTFNNKTETWVRFRPHNAYTGQDAFFPLTGTPPYRLTRISGASNASDAQRALARFLVTVACLNTAATAKDEPEENYTFLVHTSGKTDDHKADHGIIEAAMTALVSGAGAEFKAFLHIIYDQAKELYPDNSAEELTEYVIANASRSSIVVLNSNRDRASAGDKPTVPSCPFTVIIGGNIVSRGVTFPNLLSMFFTRDVANKLQQDTYIQRARMFGARGKYLKHFELTIPKTLYDDWHRCFVFHRLALQAIENNNLSPVWVGDPRISIAASSSIDRGTVDLNKGEMSFQMFDVGDIEKLDAMARANPKGVDTLESIARIVGGALPKFLIDYIKAALKLAPGTLAIHTSSSVAGYSNPEDVANISRTKGFIGEPQLDKQRFPQAIHHVKIFYNGTGKARVFYKNQGGVQFVQNMKK